MDERIETDRFGRFCAAIVRALPFGLSRIVPANLVGFAIINGFTFCVDLLLLEILHSLNIPLRLSFTIAYLCAFALSYVLNRKFNFHSHAPVGRQAVVYAVVVAINYVAFILGLGAGLAELGLPVFVARIIAACCEGVYMYCALRWVVFRDASSVHQVPEVNEPVRRRGEDDEAQVAARQARDDELA